ncbi:MAG: ATP synthase F0 subunit A [Desulfobacteraceae bacterium]|jgi:F-type H+-transporting ATPase subunit a|nr:MAG: ATP synthase F0 subunit A [Desulfobacteraceae bacterium]
MNEIGRISQLIVPVGGYTFAFNLDVIVMTWIVIGVLLFFGFMATRHRNIVPGPIQVMGEIIVSQFYVLTRDALGDKLAKTYAPLVCALFMFLLMSNWIGVLPHLFEPTTDLNTPLSLGLMGFVLAHYAGIRAKGFKKYMKAYFEPVFFMMPLNIIGELAKVISISFRLFGNIMGGSIIIMVVSYLTYSVLLPPFLYAFFGFFIGTIQAFVFTMLTIVYIAVQVE